MYKTQVPLLDAHLTPLVQQLVAIFSSAEVASNVRIMALSVLRWLISWKTKAVVRRNLVPSILHPLFECLSAAEAASGLTRGRAGPGA